MSERLRSTALRSAVSAVDKRLQLGPLPYRQLGLRIGNLPRYVIDEVLHRVGPVHLKKTAIVGIGIDVQHRVVAQFCRMLFHPFGGTEQSRLLAIPGAINNGPPRFPPLLAQFAQRSRFFQLRHHPGNRIFRAIHPRVVVVAADHPFVRGFVAGNLGDDVIDRL